MGNQQSRRIVIAGGTGFLGRPLTGRLLAAGHAVTRLSRDAAGRAAAAPALRVAAWTPDGTAGPWASAIDGADAVINLAGEPIAGRRWTAAQKQRILDSRVAATRSLVRAIAAAAAPPALLINASGVGYYGPCGDEWVPETHAPGSDFLATVCRQWEEEAAAAATDRTRVVIMRNGLVLERDGGALPPMLPPFRAGIGGRLGSGRQYWPWIHREDWLALTEFVLETPAVSGPMNATAPTPVTNREFTTALGRAMHRPSLMPAPALALRLLLGEMADGLLLSGQRAVPKKAQDLGFVFKYTSLDAALAELFDGD